MIRKRRFVWLERIEDKPEDALGFDFDGAAFTHVGQRVTFEVLLASFGLESDPALKKLAALVHCLDVGGLPVSESAGVEMVLGGARQRCAMTMPCWSRRREIFDDLYVMYEEGKVHMSENKTDLRRPRRSAWARLSNTG